MQASHAHELGRRFGFKSRGRREGGISRDRVARCSNYRYITVGAEICARGHFARASRGPPQIDAEALSSAALLHGAE